MQLEFPEEPDDDPLKVITGLWLFTSVTVKFLVVSCTTSVTVPESCELTENFTSPFVVVTVVGSEFPFTLVFGSPELKETDIVSLTGARFMLQSRISTIKVTEPVFVVMGGLG